MDAKQQAETSWKEYWLRDQRDHKNEPEYLVAISDFKLALKAEIGKEIENGEVEEVSIYERVLQLIDETNL